MRTAVPFLVVFLAVHPSTYRTAGLRRGTATSRSTSRGTTSIAPDGLGTPLERIHQAAALLTGRTLAILLAPIATPLAATAAGRSLFFAMERSRPWQLPADDARQLLLDFAQAPGYLETVQATMVDVPTRLERITCPVLLVQGTAAHWSACRALASSPSYATRPADGRAAVADGLEVLATSDEPYWVGELCRSGLAVAAALAEQARDRHAEGEEQAARELAGRLVERVRAAVAAPGVVPTPVVEANLLTVEAEWARVAGPSDPERWAAGAEAWEALGHPWQAGYARWRQAEAPLARGAPRADAAAALARARPLAAGLGARPLVAEIDSLSRRARLELGLPPDGPAPDGAAEQPTTATDELGLTPREREVLALLADGRTNRQVAEALFISDKTASVHVSNILAKLGVANRGEAAAVAHRLRLTG